MEKQAVSETVELVTLLTLTNPGRSYRDVTGNKLVVLGGGVGAVHQRELAAHLKRGGFV